MTHLIKLSTDEFEQLQHCEQRIQEGFKTFVDVGTALNQIRDNQLYRDDFDNFDDYTQQRWGWTKAHAYRLINAAQTVGDISENPAIDILPKNERQVRPLVKLHPEDRTEAWQQALDESDGKPTEAIVQSVVDRRKPTVGRDGPPDWYTPKKYISLVRKVFDDIDLDPASCADANNVIGATTYYATSEGRDGLREPWLGRVYLNPPYGRKVIQSWIEKAIEEYEKENASEIIICINNATDTQWFQDLWNYSLCFVRGRIKFYGPHNKTDSPAHGTVFAYLGDNNDRFAESFKDVGPVLEWSGDNGRVLHINDGRVLHDEA